MMGLLKDIARHRELLAILIARNLKIRYKGSILGFLWSLLTPALFILIYAVFARILRFYGSRPNYLPFLIVGIVVWQFLSLCLNDSLGVIAGNSSLVKKTSFPRLILPLSTVLANLVNFLLTFVVLVAYLLIVRIAPGNVLWLPVVILSQTALCLGMALLLSTANVFFRDTEHILSILILAWFFLTPIFYGVEMQLDFVRPSLQWLAFLNPMTGITTAYRAILMSEPSPSPAFLSISFALCWISLALGATAFQKFQYRFADVL